MFREKMFIGVNYYINYNSLVDEEENLDHKFFVMEMVDKLLERFTTLSYSSTISVYEKQDPIRNSRKRVNHKHTHLPPGTVEIPTAYHFMTIYLKSSTCKYFSYDMVCFRANG